jgi:hypothetical protein
MSRHRCASTDEVFRLRLEVKIRDENAVAQERTLRELRQQLEATQKECDALRDALRGPPPVPTTRIGRA